MLIRRPDDLPAREITDERLFWDRRAFLAALGGTALVAMPAERLEAEASEFHDRVRAAYLALAKAEPDRFLVVDAARPVGEIADAIRARVASLL